MVVGDESPLQYRIGLTDMWIPAWSGPHVNRSEVPLQYIRGTASSSWRGNDLGGCKEPVGGFFFL